VGPGDQEHRDAAEIGQRARIVRQHGAQQDGASEQGRLFQQQRPGDVGAVGITERDRLRHLVGRAGAPDEVGELNGALREIGNVPDAVGRAAEEPRQALLVHLAARRQQCVAGRNPLGERQQIVLVPAGAVKEQKRWRARILPGDEAMDVAQIGLVRRCLVHEDQLFRWLAFQYRSRLAINA
jgi:hypothetical protein